MTNCRRISLAIISVFSVIVGSHASAAGTLYVWNLTDASVTVNVKGLLFGCNTSAGSQCTIPLSDGMHLAIAQTAYGTVTENVPINNDTHKWCIYTDDDKNAFAKCQTWLSR